MKPWNMALLGLTLLAIAGCRSDPAVPILERQLRLQEDEIYRLRAQLDAACNDSSHCSDRGASERTSEPRDGAPDSRSSGRSDSAPSVPSFQIDYGTPGSNEPPKGFDPGTPPVPDDEPAKKQDETSGPMFEHGGDKVSSRMGRTTMVSQSSGQPFTPGGDSRRVASIVLNRILTGGISENATAGDQGLLVVVEPRDRDGRTIDAPAEMSVVVIDPALEGDAARVARWDFTPGETASLFRRAGASRAIHLTMTWPDGPPVNRQLHLFVRYVTADGRKLQADQSIEIALAGDQTAKNETPSDQVGSRRIREPRPADPAPHVAARQDEANKPRRPVWSPDRQ